MPTSGLPYIHPRLHGSMLGLNQSPDRRPSTRRSRSLSASGRRRSVAAQPQSQHLLRQLPGDDGVGDEGVERRSEDKAICTGQQRSKSEGRLCSPTAERRSFNSQISDNKKDSLKMQKKNYRSEKKRAAQELLSTLKDPTIIVMADWLKVRGTLKTWTKLWCVLKPGLFILYKNDRQKPGHWVGTVMLKTCEAIERPSKKDGFCFKLFNPLDQSIWATKGPKGETIGALTILLPHSYLIFRAPSEGAGKCWMDALELTQRCSGLLMRSMSKETKSNEELMNSNLTESGDEQHFQEHGLDEDRIEHVADREEEHSAGDTEDEEINCKETSFNDEQIQPPEESPYQLDAYEELGQQGEECQTEEVSDENKSLIWSLMKQVRPGMDLSKVVLPTFILEPRSLLLKFSDYFYHADLLSVAVKEDDPFTRMKCVVRWFLSGFYKKPKGLKKPYNPSLGEVFRCYWQHPNSNSRTFYIAEQVSHHPPVSAFHVTNRQDGYSVNASILAKSKFHGNSVAAIMDGDAILTLLSRGEDYIINMPYANCKGILVGTLTMELGGKVSIDCEKTGYSCELDFKLKPFFGQSSNRVAGKISLGSEIMATIDGHWDQKVMVKDRNTKNQDILWNPTDEVKRNRLKRSTIPIELQQEHESQRLWMHVSEAIEKCDQQAATDEKFIVEEIQRKDAAERKARMIEYSPKLFVRHPDTGDWIYRYDDPRPWDPKTDVVQYESDFVIQTSTRHCRQKLTVNGDRARRSSNARLLRMPVFPGEQQALAAAAATGAADIPNSPTRPAEQLGDSDPGGRSKLETILSQQQDMNESIERLQRRLSSICGRDPRRLGWQREQEQDRDRDQDQVGFLKGRDWVLLSFLMFVQMILYWVVK